MRELIKSVASLVGEFKNLNLKHEIKSEMRSNSRLRFCIEAKEGVIKVFEQMLEELDSEKYGWEEVFSEPDRLVLDFYVNEE